MATEKPSTFRRNRHLFVALALVLVMAGAFFFVSRRDIKLPAEPLRNVPRSASAVLFVRPEAVLRSPWLTPILRERGVESALANVRRRCSLDPVQQVEDLILFVEGRDTIALEHLGLVARGPFEHEKLARCLEQAFREDSLGAMRRIEIDGVPAIQPQRGNERAAFLGRRGIVIGTLALVRQMIGTIRDDKGSIADDATLARLWAAVSPGGEVVFAGHLPSSHRDYLSRALGAERAAPILDAITGLRALGVGARVSSGLGLGTMFAFDAAASATAFTTKVRVKLDQAKDNFLISLTPFGGIVRRIQIEQRGADVVMTVDVPQENFDRALQFASGLATGGIGGGGSNPLLGLGAGTPAPAAAAPDAVIRPAPASP